MHQRWQARACCYTNLPEGVSSQAYSCHHDATSLLMPHSFMFEPHRHESTFSQQTANHTASPMCRETSCLSICTQNPTPHATGPARCRYPCTLISGPSGLSLIIFTKV